VLGDVVSEINRVEETQPRFYTALFQLAVKANPTPYHDCHQAVSLSLSLSLSLSVLTANFQVNLE